MKNEIVVDNNDGLCEIVKIVCEIICDTKK